MLGVESTDLPEGALLGRYRQGLNYTDCWTTTVRGGVTHAEFVRAFYASGVFRPERVALRLAGLPAADDDLRRLAEGAAVRFGAWDVEDRAENQLLLRWRHTRSWLMIAPERSGKTRTRLYFGSAVTAREDARAPRRPVASRAMIAFHRAYSWALLAAAAARL